MPNRLLRIWVVALSASSFLAGCTPNSDTSRVAEFQAPPGEPKLTPERAKQALVERMRAKRGDDLSLFDPDEWSKVPLEARENGWYSFGGTFGINPDTASYTLTIRPEPGVRACTFGYQGSFSVLDGRWVAGPPELVSTALQAGK